MFSLAFKLPKAMSSFAHQNCLENSKQKQRGYFDQRNYIKQVLGNNLDFLAIEITSKKVRGNNVHFSTSEITPKKNKWKQHGFSTREITSKKVRGNEVHFSISEITSKKYVEMTWKLVEIWSSTYRRNIDVEATWIRRGVPVGLQHH